MKPDYSITALCTTLVVPPSTYYDWKDRCAMPGARALEDQLLTEQIAAIHNQSRQTYGSPRIVAALRQQGHRHGRNRVSRLMRQTNLCGRQKARYRVRTTDSNHDQPIAPNLMAESAPATAPNQIWVGDITYIETQEGWLYLAAVLDRYSRKIVGWAMSERIDAALVLKAFAMARLHRQPTTQILFHSDRGVQYASAAYRQALTQAGLLPSMSRKGNCYDNATMESFWSTLKLELVYRTNFVSRAQARTQIFDYIEAFYNRQRAHSALNYLSPVDFEAHNN
jgi:putative transposase